nr:MAG TPA: hypothetical protein [Caudoviricetes sp.]
MITKTINNKTLGIMNGTIQFPNEYCFSFNPNYIFFELGDKIPSVLVEVTDGTTSNAVSCALYRGSGRCYVSKLMELLFNKEYLTKRSAVIIFRVYSAEDNDVVIAEQSTIGIWGSMKVGDTFGGGTMLNNLYDASNHAKFMREVKWFKAFPFKVSMFSPAASKSVTLKEDGGTENVVLEETTAGIFEIVLTGIETTKKELLYKIELDASTILSSFTNVFDKTFTGAQYKYLDELLKVSVSNEKEGYYIRWIDQYGFLEYWLFKDSTLTNKNKLGDTSIEEDKPIGGIYYANHERTTHVENTTTIKCGATNLTKGQYKVVSTILASPHIDLFKGYDMERNEIWIPINIVAGSSKCDETKILQDFQLQFTMPDTASQTL